MVTQTLDMIRNEIHDTIRNHKLLAFALIYFLMIFLLGRIGKFIEIILQIYFNRFGNIPFNVLIPYFSMVIIITVMSMLLTLDSFSGMRSRRESRYLFTFLDKNSYLMSRLIVPFLTIAVLVLITSVWLLIESFDILRRWIVPELLSVVTYILLLALALISINLFVSSMTKTPGSSMRISVLALIILILFNFMGNLAIISPFSHIMTWIEPSTLGENIRSAIILLAYPVIFIPLTSVINRYKDE